MECSQDRILITALGYGASWSGDAALTPWSVYLTRNGLALKDGGAYPDDSKGSRLVLSKLTMEDAILLADRLAAILTELGYSCVTEAIADA